jgi:uncharacterized protein YggT (Ycf19 family)
MGYVDFILNLAGLLLWINWRSLPHDPFNKRTPATLVGTLRRAAPSRFRRWHLLLAIGALLVCRAGFYRLLGPALNWTGRLDLGVIILSFRSDWLDHILLFSCLSFICALGIFYACLLLLSILAPPVTAMEQPIYRLVRIQLGRVESWPRWAKLISPWLVFALVWCLLSWWLARMGVIPELVSMAHRLESAGVIGLGGYLVWKYLAAALLVVHLMSTYIYFGKNPFWSYVNAEAQSLLTPLKKIPLRVGKVDFAPVVGIVLVFLLAGTAVRGLVWLYGRLPF